MSAPLRRIVFVASNAQARVLTHDADTTEPVRDVMGLDQFAQAVARGTAARVEVTDGPVLPTDSAGVLYAGDGSVVSWILAEGVTGPGTGAASRLVRLQLPRPGALGYLAATGLAGAIELSVYLDWLSRPGRPGVASLLGRVEAAEEMGAEVSFREGHYCILRLGERPRLPDLLGAYLEAYVALLESGQLPVHDR